MCVNENTHLKWLGIRCMLCFFLFVHDKHWDCTTLLTLLSDAMGLQINLLHTCVIAADFFFLPVLPVTWIQFVSGVISIKINILSTPLFATFSHLV